MRAFSLFPLPWQCSSGERKIIPFRQRRVGIRREEKGIVFGRRLRLHPSWIDPGRDSDFPEKWGRRRADYVQ